MLFPATDNRVMRTRWKPSVTVAAVIEREGRFLLVEEHTPEGLRLNNPAGHLDPGESLVDACRRETLEETAFSFTPTAMVGIYLSRFQRISRATTEQEQATEDITYLRFAFCGSLGAFDASRALDTGIVRTLWLSADEIRQSSARHRSPLLVRCMEDYLRGQRFALDAMATDASVYR
jgi:8-oxo-dGTP pyrophosphatase MutT (NUDIX family)